VTARGRVTFLGSGTSAGVPMIGCRCAVCLSDDPRDKRLRPSILVTGPHGQVLVDTGPDLRQQALTYGIDRLDAVLFTHSHADHILGLDEVRRFNHMQGRPLPCYATEATWADIRRTFHYAFDDRPRTGGVWRRVRLRRAPARGARRVAQRGGGRHDDAVVHRGRLAHGSPHLGRSGRWCRA